MTARPIPGAPASSATAIETRDLEAGKVIDLMAVLVDSLKSTPFPRASDETRPEYFRLYRRDATALMRAWLTRALADFFDLFGEDLDATDLAWELDARIVAEDVATKEIGRRLNQHETRLIRECVRDILSAAIAMRQAKRMPS